MNLSDVDPSDIQLVSPPPQAAPAAGALKLSDVDPSDIQMVGQSGSPSVSPVTAAATGVIGGVPLAKQVGAIGGTAMDAITGVAGPLGGGSIQDLIDDYKGRHEKLQSDFAKAAAAHPAISAAGNVAGGVASLGLAGPAAMSSGGLAATGAAQGLDNSDLTKPGQALTNAATGAGTNLITGSAIKAAAPIVGKALAPVGNALKSAATGVSDWLGDSAGDLAEKATGATAVQASRFKPGTGRALLDTGTVGFGSSPQNIADNAQSAMNASGTGISDALDTLDKQGVRVDRNTVLKYIQNKIDSLAGDDSQTELANQLKTRMGNIEEQIPGPSSQMTGMQSSGKTQTIVPATYENDALLADPNVLKPARQVFGDAPEVDRWLPLRGKQLTEPVEMSPIGPKFEDVPGDSTIPISKAEEIKRGYQGNNNYNNPTADAADKIVASAYRQSVEDSATAADSTIGKKFIADKETYGLMSPVQAAAERRATQLNQNPVGGFLDVTTGLAGAAVAGAPGAAAGLIAKRTLMPRAAAMAAVSADQLSNVVRATPAAFGKFSSILQTAAARGGASLGATDYILQQTSPDYREQRDKIFNPSEDDQNGP